MTTTNITALEILAQYIREHGAIPTVRVSSAQAQGAAKRYAYWGAVRYELRLTRDGHVANTARERASSDRRSLRLAERDASGIAASEGRIELGTIGRISERTATAVLVALGLLPVESSSQAA